MARAQDAALRANAAEQQRALVESECARAELARGAELAQSTAAALRAELTSQVGTLTALVAARGDLEVALDNALAKTAQLEGKVAEQGAALEALARENAGLPATGSGEGALARTDRRRRALAEQCEVLQRALCDLQRERAAPSSDAVAEATAQRSAAQALRAELESTQREFEAQRRAAVLNENARVALRAQLHTAQAAAARRADGGADGGADGAGGARLAALRTQLRHERSRVVALEDRAFILYFFVPLTLHCMRFLLTIWTRSP